MTRRPKPNIEIDRELSGLPQPVRGREYMMRIEALIFTASRPVQREVLTAVIGSDCNLEDLIEDIRDELRSRPYELVEVAGGYQYRTRRGFAEVIRAAGVAAAPPPELSRLEQLVLTVVAYFQPVTRLQIAELLGKPVGRDAIAALRGFSLIATGPRRPQLGAPHTYVTTSAFLELAGLPGLRDLPDLDRLEEAGLLGQAAPPLPDELRNALGIVDEIEAEEGTDVQEGEELVQPSLSVAVLAQEPFDHGPAAVSMDDEAGVRAVRNTQVYYQQTLDRPVPRRKTTKKEKPRRWQRRA
jgi:segregation and condensation protein B